MKLLSECKVRVGYGERDIFEAIYKKYHLKRSDIARFEIVKESVDARKKPDVVMSLNIAIEAEKSAERKCRQLPEILVSHTGLEYEKINFLGDRPVVVGFGPSGMFAGLALALAGFKPIILEQGKKVDERQKDVDEFWKNRKLNRFSNVQFGEGGAGTFSDGKLASNVSNSYTKKVINEFILAGAPSEIFYSSTPHIGSDRLKEVVSNIRKKIEQNGGEVIFNAHFEGFSKNGDRGLFVNFKNVQSEEVFKIEASALILAVGHSAGDVYQLLNNLNCKLVPKPFAMGVRIEHSQQKLDFAQYGKLDKNLPSSNYKLVTHLKNGRSVFSFCMCPGGTVVASSSEEGTIVTNGMSNYARDGKNANSALLVNVSPADYEGDDALSGLRFQKKYERLAFELGGGNFDAPAEKVKDFLSESKSVSSGAGDEVFPTYLPNVKFTQIKNCLPDFVAESLKEALPIFDKKINGFADGENILIGIESRSSSPVQIVRDENFMCNLGRVFVCGEGAGYAGGITSSAQDGIKCAEKVMEFLKN